MWSEGTTATAGNIWRIVGAINVAEKKKVRERHARPADEAETPLPRTGAVFVYGRPYLLSGEEICLEVDFEKIGDCCPLGEFCELQTTHPVDDEMPTWLSDVDQMTAAITSGTHRCTCSGHTVPSYELTGRRTKEPAHAGFWHPPSRRTRTGLAA